MIKKCKNKNCGNLFRTWKSKITAGKGKFCSTRCAYDSFIGRVGPFTGRKHTNEAKKVMSIKAKQHGAGKYKHKKLTKVYGMKFRLYKSISKKQGEEIKRLRELGYSLRWISKKYKTTNSTVLWHSNEKYREMRLEMLRKNKELKNICQKI